jgi:tetratricopeptide (TPR) repeat protein
MVEMVESLATSQEQINVTSRSKGPVPSKVSQIIPGSSDYDLILADYTRAVQLQPSFFFGFFNRAYIYLKQGKYPDAMDDLNKAIALEPEFAEAYYNRGLARLSQGFANEGIADLSKAGELGIVNAYSIIKRMTTR